MARTCTICSHPERAKIEAAIANGTANRPIASQFGVGYKSVERHAADHIQQAIQHVQVAKHEAQSIDVVKQLKTINSVTIAILTEARRANNNLLALSAIDRVQKQIELQAKLFGDLDKQQIPQVQEVPEGLLIPSERLSAHARMDIRRILLEDEQRKERRS